MNVENILKVADAIEQHSIPTLGFNMSDYVSTSYADKSGHKCNTVACIAGWAAAIKHPVKFRRLNHVETFDLAAKFFGIDDNTAFSLFIPDRLHDRITPEQAVRTLRHFAATGAVKWNVRAIPA